MSSPVPILRHSFSKSSLAPRLLDTSPPPPFATLNTDTDTTDTSPQIPSAEKPKRKERPPTLELARKERDRGERERPRERERERDRDQERDRNRDRDRERTTDNANQRAARHAHRNVNITLLRPRSLQLIDFCWHRAITRPFRRDLLPLTINLALPLLRLLLSIRTTFLFTRRILPQPKKCLRYQRLQSSPMTTVKYIQPNTDRESLSLPVVTRHQSIGVD
jgi:hypothetical protein